MSLPRREPEYFIRSTYTTRYDWNTKINVTEWTHQPVKYWSDFMPHEGGYVYKMTPLEPLPKDDPCYDEEYIQWHPGYPTLAQAQEALGRIATEIACAEQDANDYGDGRWSRTDREDFHAD